jgi:hypothetical protein
MLVKPAFAKAIEPIVVTPDGMVTDSKELHPAKARLPIDVSEEGRVTEVRDVQLQKVAFGSSEIFAWSTTDSSDSQSLNSIFPIFVTDAGIVMDFRFTIPEKAPSSMVVSEEGRVSDSRRELPSEAAPSSVIPAGSASEVSGAESNAQSGSTFAAERVIFVAVREPLYSAIVAPERSRVAKSLSEDMKSKSDASMLPATVRFTTAASPAAAVTASLSPPGSTVTE